PWWRPSLSLVHTVVLPHINCASSRLIGMSFSDVATVFPAVAQVPNVHPLRPEVTRDDGDWKIVIQTGRVPHSKGPLRDRAIAVGEHDTDHSPGFLSRGDDDDDETIDEESDDS